MGALQHAPSPYVLHAAAARDDVRAVRVLLRTSRTDVNAGDALVQRTPLHVAAQLGRAAIAAALLAAGARADERTEDGDGPLVYACMGGHAGIVKMLLAAGADPRARNAYGQSVAETAGCADPAILALLQQAPPVSDGVFSSHLIWPSAPC
jgi:hypothetical protein